MNELSEKDTQLVNSLQGDTRDLVNRLLEMVDDKEDRKTTIAAANHTELINLEQLYYELETNYYELQKSLQTITSEKEYVLSQLEEQKKKANDLEDELARVEKEHSGSGDIVMKLKLENQQLQEESILASNLSESRQKQLDLLNGRIDELNVKFQEAEKSELSLKSELAEVQIHRDNLKIQLQATSERCSLLNDELTEAQKSSLSLHKEQQETVTRFVSQITELKQQVAALQIERDRAIRSKEQSQHDMESLQSRYQSLKQDSLETTGSLSLLKTKSTQILNEQIRIQSLKDDQIRDLESQLSSLKQVAEEMKKALEQVNQEKAHLISSNSSLESTIKEKDKQLAEMKNKRSTIREETGLVLSKLQMNESTVKSALAKRGLSITDLYSRIIVLEEDLEKMRRGKNEVEMHLEHVLKEIEEKTPVLQQQQVEYQTMVTSQQRLSKMYATATDELQQKERELTRMKSCVEEEKERGKQNELLIEDLKQQVQSLLKQQVDASGEMSYGDVKELQEKNMELMRRIHSLEEERDKENEENSVDSQLRHELDDLKKEREEQQTLMNTLVKQRDMYRVLLAEKDTATVQANGVSVSQATASELKKQLDEVTKLLTKEREEFETSMTRLTESVNEKEIDLVKMKKKWMMEQQSHQQTKETVNQLEKVTSTLEMKSKQCENDMITLQQTVLTKQKEADDKQEMVITLSGENAVLKQQVTQLTSTVEALKETREQWQEERKKLRLIIDEVQQTSNSIQLQYNNNLIVKQSELEKLEKHCKELEGELNELRSVQISRLNEAFEKERVLSEQMNAYQTEIKQLKAKLSLKERKEKEKEESTTEQEKRIKLLESRVNAQLQSLASSSEGGVQVSLEQYRNVERELAKKEIEVMSLQNTIENANHHVEEYQSMANAMEEELKRYKEEKEKELKEVKLELIEKTTEIGKIKEKEAEKEKMFSSSASVMQDQEVTIKKQANEIDSLTQQVKEITRLLNVERGSLETMERNYRTEFQKHSEDLSSWKEKEKYYQEEQVKVAEMRKNVEAREKMVEEQLKSVNEETKKWKETLAEKELCLDSLKKQNDVLFSQITELTRQHRLDDVSSDTPSGEEEIANLRDVMISLRRENEITKSSLILEKNTNSELETKVKKMEETEKGLLERIQSLSQELTEFKQKGDIEELIHNNEELKKLLTLYTESNTTLRGENERTKKEVAEVRGEIEQLNKVIGELRQEKIMTEQKLENVSGEYALYKKNYSIEQYNLLIAAKNSLATESERMKTTISSLQGEVTTLQKKIVQLNTQIQVSKVKGIPSSSPSTPAVNIAINRQVGQNKGVTQVSQVKTVSQVPQVEQVAQVKPATPVAQVKPATSVAQVKPVTPVAQVKPVTAAPQVKPVTPVAQVKTATAVPQVKPVTAAPQVKPVTPVAQVKTATAVTQTQPVTQVQVSQVPQINQPASQVVQTQQGPSVVQTQSSQVQITSQSQSLQTASSGPQTSFNPLTATFYPGKTPIQQPAQSVQPSKPTSQPANSLFQPGIGTPANQNETPSFFKNPNTTPSAPLFSTTQSSLNPGASPFPPTQGNRLFQGIIQNNNASMKRDNPTGETVQKKQKVEGGVKETIQNDEEQKMRNRQQRFLKNTSTPIQQIVGKKVGKNVGKNAQISHEELMLKLRYMMYLKPDNPLLKKLFTNYSTHEKNEFPANLLIKPGMQVGLTAEQLNKMRSIKTEEDLAKHCIH